MALQESLDQRIITHTGVISNLFIEPAQLGRHGKRQKTVTDEAQVVDAVHVRFIDEVANGVSTNLRMCNE